MLAMLLVGCSKSSETQTNTIQVTSQNKETMAHNSAGEYDFMVEATQNHKEQLYFEVIKLDSMDMKHNDDEVKINKKIEMEMNNLNGSIILTAVYEGDEVAEYDILFNIYDDSGNNLGLPFLFDLRIEANQDVNKDGSVDIKDIVVMIDDIVNGGSKLGKNIEDIVNLINDILASTEPLTEIIAFDESSESASAILTLKPTNIGENDCGVNQSKKAEVNISENASILGLQFGITGTQISAIEDLKLEEAGFTTSNSNANVLAFSFTYSVADVNKDDALMSLTLDHCYEVNENQFVDDIEIIA